MIGQRATALLASATVISLGGPLFTATAADARSTTTNKTGASVTIAVTGVPKKQASKGLVKLVGPTGDHKTYSWKAGLGKQVKGLQPGLYAIRANWLVTKSGKAYTARAVTRWVKVKKNATVKVPVRYKPARPGAVIPPPLADWVKIDMADACHFLTGDALSKAHHHNKSDPFSWYCHSSSGKKSSMDLNRFCAEGIYYHWNRHAMNKGMDWYCVKDR